jgi:S1-C subfamily serine protease
MTRTVLYSRSGPARPRGGQVRNRGVNRSAEAPKIESQTPDVAEEPPKKSGIGARWAKFSKRHDRLLLVFTAVVSTLVIMGIVWAVMPNPHQYTQNDIDKAVQYTLEHQPKKPSEEAVAYDKISPSVVQVTQYGHEKGKTEDVETGIGTGVIISEQGTILTNLHVVGGADKVMVKFYNGLESEAQVTGVRPELDLAVLEPKTLPDDIKPATLRSTKGLHMGDRVIAVGHPFGIGKSVSAGVISGFRREYRKDDKDPTKKELIENLIQFDAAANPGNSGGPLTTMDGDVVGIVTAIFNPNKDDRTFVGIGFAVPIEAAAAAAGESPF